LSAAASRGGAAGEPDSRRHAGAGDALASLVQVEQLVDERGADAEEGGHLADGAVAARGGSQDLLPPV
jgi:hypothetical protein